MLLQRERNVPDLFFKPSAKNSGCARGKWIVSRTSVLTWASPPTSSHEIFGIFGAPILSEYDSLAFLRAILKSAAFIDTIEYASRSRSLQLNHVHCPQFK